MLISAPTIFSLSTVSAVSTGLAISTIFTVNTIKSGHTIKSPITFITRTAHNALLAGLSLTSEVIGKEQLGILLKEVYKSSFGLKTEIVKAF